MNATEMDTMFDLGVQDAQAAILQGEGAQIKDIMSLFKTYKGVN